MVQKLISLIVILSNLSLYSAQSKASEYLKPEETIVAFDLNKVIVDLDIMGTIFNAVPALMSPLSLWKMYQQRQFFKNYTVKEEFFEKVFEEHPDLKVIFEPMYLKGAACQNPNYEMINLVVTLKENDYTSTIFSNMGSKMYHSIKENNPELKDVLANFDALEMVPCKEEGYLCKPQPAYYDKYIIAAREIKPELKNIIFVDDREENIKGFDEACKKHRLNFYGFFFKKENANAQRLGEFLHNLLGLNFSK